MSFRLPGIPDPVMSTGQALNESYPASPLSVPRAREAVVRFARESGATEEQLEAIRLAASEAITNAVTHAYGEENPGAVHVTAACTPGELWLLIADDGRGLHARSNSPGLGMGLALIACVADYFAVMKRASGGTEIRMRFATGVGRPSRHSRMNGSLASLNAAA